MENLIDVHKESIRLEWPVKQGWGGVSMLPLSPQTITRAHTLNMGGETPCQRGPPSLVPCPHVDEDKSFFPITMVRWLWGSVDGRLIRIWNPPINIFFL